jgi:hypothetical protein
MDKPLVDISDYSFDDFIAFLFARDVQELAEQAHPRKWNPWYFHVEVAFDAQQVCEFYVRLFRQPTFLLERFSKPQLEEGFWGIQGPNLDCSAWNIISNTDLPIAAREKCISSMLDLFKYLFAIDPLEAAANMWWDSICYDWQCGNRARERGGEDLLLQDAMFQTLASILELDSEPCQRAALHGLGHLHHPNTQELIQRYLDRNPLLPVEQRAYALSAAKFEVQ